MFDQMRQCMMFMTQEYATAEMSSDLVCIRIEYPIDFHYGFFFLL
jgi:hypothetical protein